MSKNNKDIGQMMLMINKMNQDAQMQVNKVITEHFTEEIMEIRDGYNKLKTDVEILKEQNNEVKNDLNVVRDDFSEQVGKIAHLEDFNYVLRNDQGKLKELRKAVQRKVFSYVGSKDSVEYILFYNSFIRNCYEKVFDGLEVNSAPEIRINDFSAALTLISKWRPTKFYIDKKINEYVKMQSKGTLKEHLSNALDLYLDKTQGGTISIIG